MCLDFYSLEINKNNILVNKIYEITSLHAGRIVVNPLDHISRMKIKTFLGKTKIKCLPYQAFTKANSKRIYFRKSDVEIK